MNEQMITRIKVASTCLFISYFIKIEVGFEEKQYSP